MDRTVERRIAITLHDSINQILAVAIKGSRASFGLNNAFVGFHQSEDDKTATMIGDGKDSFCEGRLVIVRPLQIEPILRLEVEVFSWIDQQICKAFATGLGWHVYRVARTLNSGQPNKFSDMIAF